MKSIFSGFSINLLCKIKKNIIILKMNAFINFILYFNNKYKNIEYYL